MTNLASTDCHFSAGGRECQAVFPQIPLASISTELPVQHLSIRQICPVPRLQIVTVEEAMRLRDRALRLPARRDDAFKRAAVEKDPGAQGRLDL